MILKLPLMLGKAVNLLFLSIKLSLMNVDLYTHIPPFVTGFAFYFHY